MRRWLGFAVAVLAVGCSDATAPTTTTLSGDYALDAVDGKPLPVKTVSFEGGTYYIVSLQVHLETSGRVAPSYVAFERDSVVFRDGKPIISTNSYGGAMVVAGPDLIGLANFPGVTGAARTIAGISFTIPTAAGVMRFQRIQ